MTDRTAIADAARDYLAAGLCVLPARRDQKRPTVGSWKRYQQRRPAEAELTTWLDGGVDAICCLCGAISGNLEILDFDGGGELFPAWWDRIPEDVRDRLVVESTPSGGRHVVYRCQAEVCGNLRLARRKTGDAIVTLIETRGEGGLFLCAPTQGYELLKGDLRSPPTITQAQRDVLLQAAWDLDECASEKADRAASSEPIGQMCTSSAHLATMSAENSHIGQGGPEIGRMCESPSDHAHRPGDDFNIRGDVRAVLEQHGWVRLTDRQGRDGNEYWRRPGKGSGWSATLKDRVFYVFSTNAAPFEPDRPYSPFAVYAALEHDGDYERAARALRLAGYGGDHPDDDVNMSAIAPMSNAHPSDVSENADEDADDAQAAADNADPGPTRDELLHIPGFVGELIEFCMEGAPYPSLGMAFCGALAMQAHLCGRKIREPGDLRSNIYLLALASSSAGKNYPRQLNAHLAIAANMTETLRRKFSSGEGIEDRLEAQPCTMYQTDEIDGILQSVSKAKDARHESILSVLLELYSSANMMYAMRTKAGKQNVGVIHQPHLTIFGTATPAHYYEAMSERMLTNGFFARMIIVDTGKRSAGQDAVPVDQMPQRLIETAQWWGNFQPGEHRGNLIGFYPKPVNVPYTDEAKRIADDFRQRADEEYSRAEDRNDEVAMTVWGRANENARKLALLYACSESHANPKIDQAGMRWAGEFVEHQVRRMLFMAYQYVSTSEFDRECKKALRFLRHCRNSGRPQDCPTPDWRLRRHMALSPSAYDGVIEALTKQRRIEFRSVQGTTKPRTGWMLR